MNNQQDHKYFQISAEYVEGGCSVKFISNPEYSWDLSIGVRLADRWPRDMSFRMDPEKPKDVKLLDYQDNLNSSLLVSPRFRDWLQGQEVRDLEFLPVTILDHKGRPASKDYSVVNCVRVVDAVDQQNSKFRWDGLDEPSMVVRRLALNAAALGEDDRMIRLKFVPAKILFRDDLMQAIQDQAFSGVAFSREVFGDPTVYSRFRQRRSGVGGT